MKGLGVNGEGLRGLEMSGSGPNDSGCSCRERAGLCPQPFGLLEAGSTCRVTGSVPSLGCSLFCRDKAAESYLRFLHKHSLYRLHCKTLGLEQWLLLLRNQGWIKSDYFSCRSLMLGSKENEQHPIPINLKLKQQIVPLSPKNTLQPYSVIYFSLERNQKKYFPKI